MPDIPINPQDNEEPKLTEAELEALAEKKEAAVAEMEAKVPEVEARVYSVPDPPKPKKKKGVAKVERDVQTYPIDFEGCEPPQHLWKSRRIGNKEYKPKDAKVAVRGIMHLPGRGCKEAPVMFVSPCVTMEDLADTNLSAAMQLKGAIGSLFMRNLVRVGFKDEEWFHTSIVKYTVPKLKPKPMDFRWGTPAFVDELKTIKPKIIVCLGKPSFDWFMERDAAFTGTKAYKFKLHDIQGAWFDSKEFEARIYPMDAIGLPVWKPEYLERFLIDLAQVRHELDAIQGTSVIKIVQNYVTINKATELANCFYEKIVEPGIEAVSVDCEWHGQTAYGGRLRSFQFAWKPGEAAYVRLMDDKLNYVFDKPLPVVRSIMKSMTKDRVEVIDPETGRSCSRWKLMFIGHNASADMPWLDHHVGIDVYQRLGFDTMYAQHTLNEYADLKLERLAVRYTDMGRYDLEMAFWKKKSGFDEEDNAGYGEVPDGIIIPYGQRDVDATLRIWPHLWIQLQALGLLPYYEERVRPFVTDGFYEMMDMGLPINIEFLNEMREVFTTNQNVLIREYRRAMTKDADVLLLKAMQALDPENADDAYREVVGLINLAYKPEAQILDVDHPSVAQAREIFKTFVGQKSMEAALPVFEHRLTAPMFNINSVDHLKRWMFKAMRLRPIKTTKRDGIQLSWEKVEAMTDASKRAEYEPAADKQTIKVYSEQYPIIAQLQELKAVSTIVKTFLRGPDETGKEQGLHKWVQADGRIHANFALTETARPRAWKPNILNWPKAVTRPIEAAFKRVNRVLCHEEYFRLKAQGLSPLEIKSQVMAMREKPTVLRANVQAPEGWAIVDMDLKTAEVVALAWYSGDENMIKVLNDPDTQFARIDKDNPKKVVRIAYNEISCYPKEEWDPKLVAPLDDPRILRKDGAIMHPKRDLHWEMAEAVAGIPREKCDERMYRDGCGKVGNFSIPYGASAPLLERLIEANTGKKPPTGTGSKMIDAWNTKYKAACKFLGDMENIVHNPGWWKSQSKRIRHFYLNRVFDVEENKSKKYQGIYSSLSRQARNFPMQELVAATTAKALDKFIARRRELQLRSRIGILLYDAMTAFSPLEELKATTQLLQECLTSIRWPMEWPQEDGSIKRGEFNFEVDISHGFRWGMKPSKEEKAILAQYLK